MQDYQDCENYDKLMMSASGKVWLLASSMLSATSTGASAGASTGRTFHNVRLAVETALASQLPFPLFGGLSSAYPLPFKPCRACFLMVATQLCHTG